MNKELNIVAFSGGKDSIAMVLHLLRSGVKPDQIHLHHHDVDGGGVNLWDWGCTKTYCQAFADHFGLQIFFSGRIGGIQREIFRESEGLQNVYLERGGESTLLQSKDGNSTRLKFPAVAADLRTRWCSSCVKIDVMRRVVSNIYNDPQVNYIVHTGERHEESNARAKYTQDYDYTCKTKSRNIIGFRPVINWSERMVWEIMSDFNVQPHPCYEPGYFRCSCQICIFGSENVWASNLELSPEKVAKIAQTETELGFTLYAKQTIYEKAAKGKSFLSPEKVERWRNESLGVFTSPIISENWHVPQGAFSVEKSGSI